MTSPDPQAPDHAISAHTTSERTRRARREVNVGGSTVLNHQRIVHDLGGDMIANSLLARGANGDDMPDGSDSWDPATGPGMWPALPCTRKRPPNGSMVSWIDSM
jgi:hypothetical protein